MKPHANSHENDAEHHLYEIFDVERNAVYKYGICGKPLLPDGTSPPRQRTNRYVQPGSWLDSILRHRLADGHFRAQTR